MNIARLQTFFFLSIILFISALLFSRFFSELYIYWDTEPEASSALIIPVFSLYMIWIQKSRFMSMQFIRQDSYFSGSGFILLAGGLILFIAGSFTYILLINTIAFIVIVVSSVLFLFGREVFRVTLVPILFLLFMLPIPVQAYNAVAEPLKYFIADSSAAVLSLLQIPLIIDDNVIHLPSISLLIHESCSGIRTVISVCAIGTAFAYIFLKSYLYRISFMIVAVPIGILTNILRVVIIGILAFLYDGDIAMEFHSHAWTVVTPVAILSTFLIGHYFRCHERRDT